jgi:phosphotransferase system  glucose/maltose/N-acetylglucosamine-specific IIC component
MKTIGTYMMIFGAAAIAMDFLGFVPKILIWIYKWGETNAWIIKIGLIVVGAVLYFLAPKEVENTPDEDSNVKTEEKSE